MAKKTTKKKAAKAVKKAVKKVASKKVAKKSAPKKAAKKAMKKAIAKKVVKKTAPKKVAKKTVKKAAPKKSTKKVIKKAAPKKVVKQLAPKKVVKKLVAKKAATKKVVAKKKVIAKPIKAANAPATSTTKFVKHSTHLKVGQAIPFFGGQDQHGNTVTSASFSGKKLVIYFYPKDDTPGCTLEACNLRDNYGMFKAQGYEILGVSKDPITSHKKFAEKYGLPFSLIADEDATIQKLFGAWGKKMFMGKVFDGTNRFTFVTDEKHMITKVIQEVDTKEHTSQIL
jgi:thioredoxin-dependent peroxiredoxin